MPAPRRARTADAPSEPVPARPWRRCRYETRPARAQPQCRRRRGLGLNERVDGPPTLAAAFADLLPLQDRLGAVCPKGRRARPWHTPKNQIQLALAEMPRPWARP